MYPFGNPTLNPATMMNFTTTTNRGGVPPFRSVNTSIDSGGMMQSNKIPRARSTGNAALTIRPNDVLCGRGKTSFNHSGNRRFRHIISQSIDEYRAATSKWEKSLVAARLVSVIHASGGRFLKQKKENEDQWYELSSSESKSKVSHAIRDAIAATKQSRRSSQQDTPRIKTASTSAATVVSSSSSTTTAAPPMMDESDRTNGMMDESDRTHPMMDESDTTNGMDDSDKSSWSTDSQPIAFVKPRYRGTWSSNSLVSLTDDSDEKDCSSSPAKPDRPTSKMNECWSSASNSDNESAGVSSDYDFGDDFQSYIHKILGPAHP